MYRKTINMNPVATAHYSRYFNTQGWTNGTAPKNYDIVQSLYYVNLKSAPSEASIAATCTGNLSVSNFGFYVASGSQGSNHHALLEIFGSSGALITWLYVFTGASATTGNFNFSYTELPITVKINLNQLFGSGAASEFVAGQAQVGFDYTFSAYYSITFNMPQAGDKISKWNMELMGRLGHPWCVQTWLSPTVGTALPASTRLITYTDANAYRNSPASGTTVGISTLNDIVADIDWRIPG